MANLALSPGAMILFCFIGAAAARRGFYPRDNNSSIPILGTVPGVIPISPSLSLSSTTSSDSLSSSSESFPSQTTPVVESSSGSLLSQSSVAGSTSSQLDTTSIGGSSDSSSGGTPSSSQFDSASGSTSSESSLGITSGSTLGIISSSGSTSSTLEIISSGSTSSTLSTTSLTGAITIVTTGGTTETSTLPPSDITPPPTITVGWSTVTTSTTPGVSSATHDSHGWPIIPILNCWFCPPSGGGGGGFGIIIPGITGPGILPPPPADVISSLGFLSNMPPITLNSAGDPSYPTEEPTSSPSDSTTSKPSTNSPTDSTTSKPSTSSCTGTKTGYDVYVTCTSIADSALASSSVSCETSTRTTTGCDVTTTASTTTVPACSLSAPASLSSDYDSEAAAAGTVVGGTTYPLAFWPTDSLVPDGFTISQFGGTSESVATSTSSAAISTSSTATDTSSVATSLSSVQSTLSTLTSRRSASSSAQLSTSTSSSSTSDGSSTKASSTSSKDSVPKNSPTSSPSVNEWRLTAYSVDCDTQEKSFDFSYYALSGFDEQSRNESCIILRGNLPTYSDTTNSCGWYEQGGSVGPSPCSSGTFGQPASYSIAGGFCTIYTGSDCSGDHNGVDSVEYSGCTSVKDGWVDLGNWGSISCFVYET
ncbi:hypothetical protein GGR54DRAFT_585278 [Hypoxylon sp. NC1633]|nr:hypothetical protein GGR54DRAFT_585278 [Hypoxylon sp. NC1633]